MNIPGSIRTRERTTRRGALHPIFILKSPDRLASFFFFFFVKAGGTSKEREEKEREKRKGEKKWKKKEN